jgi:hypothetical protein
MTARWRERQCERTLRDRPVVELDPHAFLDTWMAAGEVHQAIKIATREIEKLVAAFMDGFPV